MFFVHIQGFSVSPRVLCWFGLRLGRGIGLASVPFFRTAFVGGEH